MLGLALQACSSAGPVERELIIAPAPVACAGDPPETCLSASEPSGDKWLMRFDEIEGFAYEPGFTYEVLVEEPPLSQEQAVVPRLRLVRVVSKEPSAAAAAPGPLAQGRGACRASRRPMRPQDADWPDSEITARFHLGGGWVDGFAGCDRYTRRAGGRRREDQDLGADDHARSCAPGRRRAGSGPISRRSPRRCPTA